MSMRDEGSGIRAERTERAIRRLQYAAETRRFEIERFWQRSLFFWTILGAAFVAYAALGGKDAAAQQIVACFGLVASFAWTLQNRGAKYWQEAWEQKTKRHQEAALGTDLFSRIEPRLKKGWFGAAEFSVSRIAIILSDYTVVIWLVLILRSLSVEIHAFAASTGTCTIALLEWLDRHATHTVLTVTFLFCFILLIWGRSGKSGGEKADA